MTPELLWVPAGASCPLITLHHLIIMESGKWLLNLVLPTLGSQYVLRPGSYPSQTAGTLCDQVGGTCGSTAQALPGNWRWKEPLRKAREDLLELVV